MSLAELISRLGECRVALTAAGDGRLQYRAPQGALDPEMKNELAQHKRKLLDLLEGCPPIPTRFYQLSFPQRSLWYLHLFAPSSTAYNVALSMRVLAPIDAPKLRRAIQELTDRHATLRTTYCMVEGHPFQRIHERLEPAFEQVDASRWTEEELARRAAAAYAIPFDLERGPIVRAHLFNIAEADSVLLFVAPHIALDGWSLVRMVDDLGALYGERPLPPPDSYEYTDFVKWQHEMTDGADGKRLWHYWHRLLADAPPEIEWPLDHPRPAMQTLSGGSVPFQITASTVERLKALARDERTTPFVVMLAAWQALLHRFSGATDLLVGTPTHGRSRPEFAGIVGDFVNMIVLRTRLDSAIPFRALLARSRQTVLEALEHQDFPFPVLVERLQPVRDPACPPVVQAFFGYQNLFTSTDDARAASRLGDLPVETYPLAQQEGQMDLSLELAEVDGAIRATIKFNCDIFDEATAQRLAAMYPRLVQEILADPGRPLGTLARTAGSGGTIMTTAELLAELQMLDIKLSVEGDRLRVNAPAGALNDTLRAAMAALKSELIETVRAQSEAPAGSGDGARPLTFAQQRLWFMDQLEPGNPAYHVPMVLRVSGPLDAAILEQAINVVAQRQSAMRMVFAEKSGEPFQRPMPFTPARLATESIENLPEDQRDAEIRRWIIEVTTRPPFDLTKGPLWRAHLLRVSADCHYFIIVLHHIVSDVWSLAVCLNEIGFAYEGILNGRPPELPHLSTTYGDCAAAQRRYLTGERLSELLAFWKKRLDGAPMHLELPTDKPRPAVQRHVGAWVNMMIGGALDEGLRNLSRKQGATLFMTMLAGYATLLSRYAGQNQLLIGTPLAGRNLPETEALVGLFVNTLALRIDLSSDPTFVDLIKQVRERFFEAHDHQDMPFERLVEALAPERDLSRSPIFQVMFAMQSTGIKLQPIANLAIEPARIETGVTGARYDLTVSIVDREDELQGIFEYDTDLFEEPTIRRMIGHYRRILEAAVENPDCKISQLPLMSEDEESELLVSSNDTQSADPSLKLRAHELFEAQVKRQPNAIALVCAGEEITYKELNARANRLARKLRELGAAPGGLVGICIDRSPEMLVSMIAVHKTGAAYLPLDPIYPPERLAYMLDDSKAALLLTQEALSDRIPEREHVTRLFVNPFVAPPSGATEPEADFASPDFGSDALAYVIYTSGSTGKPKGVAVRQSGLTNFLLSMAREPGLSQSDTLLAVTTLCFDIAGLELWGPLCVGGRVALATREEAGNPERLTELLGSTNATIMQATPATWRMLLEAGWKGDGRLKVLCGGEALGGDLARQLLDRAGELWNMYGPTETTIWSSVHRVRREDAERSAMPLGHPIANTQFYVLDTDDRPLPAGIPGQLHIGGDGLARGYLDRPELTAERFIEHPRFGRLYRTGDLVRRTNDGELEYLGRLDNQVKLRGFRIELGEIESALGEIEGIKQAVVVARVEGANATQLAAYLIWSPDAQQLAADKIRARLLDRLPDYMVPTAFMTMTAFPLTPNGKVDRRALPAPEIARPTLSENYVSPENQTEKSIAGVWQEVLKLDRVGVNDNFFDLGGHSLLLLQVHSHLRRILPRELSLVEIFQHPTVRSLAAYIDGAGDGAAKLQKIKERAARQRATLGS